MTSITATMDSPTKHFFAVMEIRCGKCGKVHIEARGWDWYLFRCSRCGWWNTPQGATEKKPVDKRGEVVTT